MARNQRSCNQQEPEGPGREATQQQNKKEHNLYTKLNYPDRHRQNDAPKVFALHTFFPHLSRHHRQLSRMERWPKRLLWLWQQQRPTASLRSRLSSYPSLFFFISWVVITRLWYPWTSSGESVKDVLKRKKKKKVRQQSERVGAAEDNRRRENRGEPV